MSFVDTNVLVYAMAAGAPFRDRARAGLARAAAQGTLPSAGKYCANIWLP
jgi:predicted nucleic acid-binding protein